MPHDHKYSIADDEAVHALLDKTPGEALKGAGRGVPALQEFRSEGAAGIFPWASYRLCSRSEALVVSNALQTFWLSEDLCPEVARASKDLCRRKRPHFRSCLPPPPAAHHFRLAGRDRGIRGPHVDFLGFSGGRGLFSRKRLSPLEKIAKVFARSPNVTRHFFLSSPRSRNCH